jgi:hypothetical protein
MTTLKSTPGECNLKKEDTLFIAVDWIVKPAFCLFKLCPEVV